MFEQRTRPAAHATHALMLQYWVEVQAVPHVPQLVGSMAMYTHAPEQLTSGAVQVAAAQTPAVHACDAVHVTPQPPQWLRFVEVFTHAPPQRVVPAGHRHPPVMQARPAMRAG